MNYIQKFTEEEIPYKQLKRFGLTPEMISDLPDVVTQRLLAGKETPVLPVSTINSKGEKIYALARIFLVRLENDQVDVCFLPRWKQEDMSMLNEQAQQKLKNDEVCQTYIPDKGTYYVQFDKEINQVMAVPADVINYNINIITQHFQPTENAVNQIKDGYVTEIEIENDRTVTIGVDLTEDIGIRIVNGNTVKWWNDKNIEELDEYNFGLNGCWIVDKNKFMSYVAEEDYDETIIKEMKRQQLSNGANESLGQIKPSI